MGRYFKGMFKYCHMLPWMSLNVLRTVIEMKQFQKEHTSYNVYKYIYCTEEFSLSISASRECSIFSHIERCIMNVPMRLCVVLDNLI